MRQLMFLVPVALVPVMAGAAGPQWGPHCAVPAADLKAAVGADVEEPSLPASLPKPLLPPANQPQRLSGTLPKASSTPRVSGAQPALQAPTPAKAASADPPLDAQALARSDRPAEAAIGQPVTAPEIVQVPALKRIASAGATLVDLGKRHGMRTVFARSGSHFQVFYITPDGQAEIGGIMWDASGRDLTLAQVRKIPGVIPTVTIGPNGVGGREGETPHTVTYQQPAPAGAAPAVGPPEGADPSVTGTIQPTALFTTLNASTHGTVGQPDAPRLYMLIDPQCMFSIRAMHALAPYVAAGKVRLTVIPVSVLDYEDQGASTVKAKIMLSQPPQAMVADWIEQGLPEQASPGASMKLAANMALTRAIQLTGTPTFLWRTASGGLGRMNGLPPDIGTMLAEIGPSS